MAWILRSTGPRCGIGAPEVRHRKAQGAASGVSGGRKERLWGSKRASLGVEKCTVGAYEFDMLKKHESSATAKKGGRRRVARAGGKP